MRIFLLKLIILFLIENTWSKYVRQLNSFSSRCDGHTCDYVVQVSTQPGSNGTTATVAFPRQFISEMKQLQVCLQFCAIKFKNKPLKLYHTLVDVLGNCQCPL
jgi:hypothetical protein